MSLSFDLFRSFIFLGDLYPSLDNLHARRLVASIANPPLHRHSESMSSPSFDLLWSFIVSGDLCPSLGDLRTRLGESLLQYSPLRRR